MSGRDPQPGQPEEELPVSLWENLAENVIEARIDLPGTRQRTAVVE
jgi:hypothetical protein